MEANIPPKLLFVLRYAYPSLISFYFVVASTIALCLPASGVRLPKRKTAIAWLFLLIILCFIVDGMLGVAGIMFWRLWPSNEDIIGFVSCILTYSSIARSFEKTSNVVVLYQFYGCWMIGFFCDLSSATLQFIDTQDTGLSWAGNRSRTLLLLHASLAWGRCVLFGAIFSIYLCKGRQKHGGSNNENAPLPPSPNPSLGSDSVDAANTNAAPLRPTKNLGIFKILKTLFSLIQLKSDRGLQIRAGLQYGVLIDLISTSPGNNVWPQISIFAALQLLVSEPGIPLLKKLLWLPAEQHCEKKISNAAFSRIMCLSADFHDSVSPVDLHMALGSVAAFLNTLQTICFDTAPMMIDLVIAIAYLSVKFGPGEGFIALITGVAFALFSLRVLSSDRAKARQLRQRQMDENRTRNSSITQWLIISHFNQTRRQISSYSELFGFRLRASKGMLTSKALAAAVSYLIITSGSLGSIAVVVYQIRSGEATTGDIALLLSLWGQLSCSLRYFASLENTFSRLIPDLERLVDILHTEPSVADREGARPLEFKCGKVEFEKVMFSYKGTSNKVLDNFNISIESGKTVAFVGKTGAGKTTIIKLLMRQYDVQEGSIFIDGQNIQDVTQERFGRPTASDEDVYNACKEAQIHEHIMRLPEGYQTEMGEKNTKFSGGQLQLLSIARLFLRNPKIVLLDEPTSSLDADTEKKIKDALLSLCEGRTTVIIAHRLTTVMKADTIYVVSGGKITEQGNHQKLVSQGGDYANLWLRHLKG
ncbi:hypothetical protein NUW58_g6723 [Xylaria curta]|uniref:Uncharacterized protein n=1 Tax=Xylaria curta TaxID=42375 RepID=A0ACC1NPV6_9PEZI|nr:hypothetical protein NUW58_g6723 [Xylaria curta]